MQFITAASEPKTTRPHVSGEVTADTAKNQKAPANTSSWLGRTVSSVYSHMTLDNIMLASIVAGVALGAYVATTAGNPDDILVGLAVATLATAMNSMLWGLGCAAKGEYSKAANRFFVGAALGGAFKVERDLRLAQQDALWDVEKGLSDAKWKLQVTEVYLKGAESDLNGARADIENLEYRLNRLNWEKSKLESQVEDFLSNSYYQTLSRQQEKCNNDLEIALEKYLGKESEVNEKKEQISKLQSELKGSQKEVAKLKTTVKKLEDRSFTERLYNTPVVIDEEQDISGRQIVFGTTYIGGNEIRDRLSEMVDKTHREYVKIWEGKDHPSWKLEHDVVTENRLRGQCDRSESDKTKVDCVPYWNKIAVIRQWLNEEKVFDEEWRVIADDDMPVTNMNVDPNKAIDLLRRGKDTSVIVARDVQVWNGDSATAVNTGLLFVRKDDASRKLFDAIWAKRNSRGTGSEHCRTLGTCRNQDTLHEQQAMANLLREDRSLLGRVVTVVLPRETYEGQEIAINTFERQGCFIRDQNGWGGGSFSYDSDGSYPDGTWRKGDWMGQTAGVPINGWYCNDKRNGKPPGPIREDKLRNMIAQTIR